MGSRVYLFFLFSLLCWSSWSQSVSDFRADVEVFLLTQGKTISFDVFEQVGANNNADNPHRIYIPIRNDTDDNGTPTANKNFSYYAQRDNLPTIVSGSPPAGNLSHLRFTLSVNVEGVSDDLHVAIATSGTGTFSVLKFIGAQTDTTLTYDLSLTELCSSSELDCDNFNEDREPDFNESIFLYFFLADGELGEGASVDPSTTTGPFYQIYLSTKINEDRRVDLKDLLKGDSQLIADYTSFTLASDVGDSLYSLTVAGAANDLCDSVVDSTNGDDPLGPGKSFSDLTTLETLETTGQKRIKNLENNRCYQIKLYLCDRFGFCSYGSQTLENAPETIQALLEKQACFFFTAGFGEQHFIVDYFQRFRDNILKKYWLGRQFVAWYYKVAPQYTPYILSHPKLQTLIRSVAYVLYGVIHYWFAVLLFFMAFIVIQFRRRLN